MKLYHGSATRGITTLLPGQSNHDKAYVYLTDNEHLAVMYAYNPLTPPNGFFTYRFSSDGRLHYDEYFPCALDMIYGGRKGYAYTCDCQAKPLDKMPWVYVSETPVPVCECREIPDIAQELLRLETCGQLTIPRFETLPDSFKETIDKMMRREIDECKAKGIGNDEYKAFIRKHFPHLFA